MICTYRKIVKVQLLTDSGELPSLFFLVIISNIIDRKYLNFEAKTSWNIIPRWNIVYMVKHTTFFLETPTRKMFHLCILIFLSSKPLQYLFFFGFFLVPYFLCIKHRYMVMNMLCMCICIYAPYVSTCALWVLLYILHVFASPVVHIFGLPIKDHIPISPGKYHPHATCQNSAIAWEEAFCNYHLRVMEKWTEPTLLLPPLRIGDHIMLLNNASPYLSKWNQRAL